MVGIEPTTYGLRIRKHLCATTHQIRTFPAPLLRITAVERKRGKCTEIARFRTFGVTLCYTESGVKV